MYGCGAGKQKKSAGYNSDIQYVVCCSVCGSVYTYGPPQLLLLARRSSEAAIVFCHIVSGGGCSGGGVSACIRTQYCGLTNNNVITSLLLLLYGCIIGFCDELFAKTAWSDPTKTMIIIIIIYADQCNK